MFDNLEYVGEMVFDNNIDISDPCYSRNGCGNIIDYKIKEGKYGCYIKYGKPEEWEENRIAEIAIIKKGYGGTKDMVWNKADAIGVDSGLAGFFNHKNEYSNEEWSDFCDRLCNREGKWWVNFDNGFFSESGWGDGGYYVYESRNNNNEVIALKIAFIEYE